MRRSTHSWCIEILMWSLRDLCGGGRLFIRPPTTPYSNAWRPTSESPIASLGALSGSPAAAGNHRHYYRQRDFVAQMTRAASLPFGKQGNSADIPYPLLIRFLSSGRRRLTLLGFGGPESRIRCGKFFRPRLQITGTNHETFVFQSQPQSRRKLYCA